MSALHQHRTFTEFGLWILSGQCTDQCSVPSRRCYAAAGAVLRTAKAGKSVPLTLRILQEFPVMMIEHRIGTTRRTFVQASSATTAAALLPIPVFWCLLSGITLWAMGEPQAWAVHAALAQQ